MTHAAAIRNSAPGCSPVVTLRLLANSDAGKPQTIDEPEQLSLPFDWVWLAKPPRVEPPPPPAERVDPKQWGSRIALAAFEVMLGRRPAAQLARYIERLHLDSSLGAVRGVFVAQVVKPQARVLAESRGFSVVEVDYDELRGMKPDELRLF